MAMATYRMGSTPAEGLITFNSDGSTILPRIINDLVEHTASFDKHFFDSGNYKPYFYQMIVGILLSAPVVQWPKEYQVSVYHRNLGDDAIRWVILLRKNRMGQKSIKVHVSTVFLGRLALKPSRYQHTGAFGNDAHYVDNFREQLRALTREEYIGLKVEIMTRENLNLDEIEMAYAEYSIRPDKKIKNGKEKYGIKMEFEPDKSVRNLLVSDRRNFIENLRNEPLTTIDDEVTFQYSNPVDESFARNTMDIVSEDDALMIEDLTKIFENIFSFYYKPTGLETNMIAPEMISHLYWTKIGMCGFVHGILANLRYKLRHFFQNFRVNYNFDGKIEFLTMSFIGSDHKSENMQVEKPFVIDFSNEKPFGMLKYNYISHIRDQMSPSIRLLIPAYDSMKDHIDLGFKVVPSPPPFNLYRYLRRAMKAGSLDNLEMQLSHSFKSLLHSVATQKPTSMDTLEFLSAYVLGAFKSTENIGSFRVRVGVPRVELAVDEQNKDVSHFLVKHDIDSMPPLFITFSSSGSYNSLTDAGSSSFFNRDVITRITVVQKPLPNSDLDIEVLVDSTSDDILHNYNFKTIEGTEIVSFHQRGETKNYIFLNAIHPAQLVGYFRRSFSVEDERFFEEYDNEVEEPASASKEKNKKDDLSLSLMDKVQVLFNPDIKSYVKSRQSFHAMIEGMFANVPRKIVYKEDNSLELTIAEFIQAKNGYEYTKYMTFNFMFVENDIIGIPDIEITGIDSDGFSDDELIFEDPDLLSTIAAERFVSSRASDSQSSDYLMQLDWEEAASSSSFSSAEGILGDRLTPSFRRSPFGGYNTIRNNNDQSSMELALAKIKSYNDEQRRKSKRIKDDGWIEKYISLIYDSRTETQDLNRIAIASNHEPWNSDNVKRFCLTKKRLKRDGQNLCSLFDKDPAAKRVNEDLAEDDAQTSDKSLAIDPRVENHMLLLQGICGKIQMGFIGRDILGDIFNGNWNGLIRDGLFLGGVVASNAIGQRIVKEGASYLELGNELTGKILTSVGMCLPKLAMDAYFGYNIYENAKAGNKFGAVTNGIMTGIDLVECGVEALAAFGIISVSSIVAPLAALAVTAILIITNVNEAIQKTKEIEKEIPLTADEHNSEFWRAFFHIHPEPLINVLLDEKRANNLIVDNILAKSLPVRWFITSMGESVSTNGGKLTVHYKSDSTIDLRYQISRPKSTRSIPDKRPDINFFCKMAEQLEEVHPTFWDKFLSFWHKIEHGIVHIFKPSYGSTQNLEQDYFCRNSFGIEFVKNRHSNEAVFAVYDGKDSVYGFPNASNTFLIGNGQKFIHGGDGSDTFIMTGNITHGTINGSHGYNILDISNFPAEYFINICGQRLVGKSKNILMTELFLNNIQEIKGRKQASEHLVSDCSRKSIDLGGGAPGDPDLIVMPDLDCSYNISVVLSGNSEVSHSASKGTFTYFIKNLTDQINMEFHKNAAIKIIFKDLNLLDVGMKLDDVIKYNCILIFTDRGNTSFCGLLSGIDFYWKDRAHLTFDSQHPVISMNSSLSVQDIMFNYAKYAEFSRVTLIVHSTLDSETVVFNHGEMFVEEKSLHRAIKVTHNDAEHKSHLVPHTGFDNIFLIKIKPVKSINELSLPDITIYDSKPNVETKNYIDLREIDRYINSIGDYSLLVKVDKNISYKGDITLTLYSTSFDHYQIRFIGKIIISEGLINKCYKKFLVISRGQSKIHFDSSKKIVKLYPLPLMMPNKNLTIISSGQLEQFSQLFFVQNVTLVQFYNVSGSLLITNVINQMSDFDNIFSIMFLNFFTYQRLFVTVNLHFNNNRVLHLSKIFKKTNNFQPPDHLWDLFSFKKAMIANRTTY